MATNFGTKIAITGFVWTTATRRLVMEGVLVVGRQNVDIADTLHLRDVAMAITFWLSMGYNFSCMTASDTLFDPRVGFRGQAIQWRHSRDRWSKERCHGNQFRDYISCKWTLTEDNDVRLSYKGWFVFSQPLHLLVALSLSLSLSLDFVVAAIYRNCSRLATVRLGIDTLIANILV